MYGLSMLMLILTSCICTEHYYIVPNNPNGQCQSYSAGTCYTLDEFASNIRNLDLGNNLTLSFLPGKHLLTRRLLFNAPQNIALTGQPDSSNSSKYTIKCQGTSGFEFGDIESLNIACLKFTGCGNVEFGGAISINRADVIFIKSCHFIDNHVTGKGGAAIYVRDIMVAMTIEASFFNNNNAPLASLEDIVYGGGISVVHGSIITISSHYTNNSADNGGAISVYEGNISSSSDHYINNSAGSSGGAISVSFGNINSTNNQYINNSVNNEGGAIITFIGNIFSTSDHYLSNSALTGGAIIMNSGSCKLYNDSFKGNTAATNGAVINKLGGILEIVQSNITDNFASNKGALFLNNVTLIIAKRVNFINNHGSLYVIATQVQVNGVAAFMHNNCDEFGGAITAIQSQVISNGAVTVRNNTAVNGGGIYVAHSNLYIYNRFELTNNTASKCGGGIYAFRTEIEFNFNLTEIINNTALNGGAICTIDSNVKLSSTYVNFHSNRAIRNGGAMYLRQNSMIYLLKTEPDYVGKENLKVRLDFTNNSAKKGGALYSVDDANDGAICQGANREAECFIQTLSSYNDLKLGIDIFFINTFFINNTALQSGNDIYGGLLDRCTRNPSAEVTLFPDDYQLSNGFDYIKATTQIEQIIEYSEYAKSHPAYLINSISKSDVIGLISSDGILVFCVDSVIRYRDILTKKGELFTVSVAVVDQVENLVNTIVSSTLSSESGNGHFKGGQSEQQVGNQCTELEYNVYSQDNSANMKLHLYADGPCGTIEVSNLTLNLVFLPCECPVGFQPSSAQTECICECDRRLEQYQITSCFAKNGTIRLDTNIWIGVTNGTGFVIQDCPFDYCVQKPVNINLSNSDSADEQCAYKRTGILCGMCKDISLVLGSSRCEQCSNYYIFLLVPFALAGIALVAFVLLFNMTVATGTIHGLIFYANILTANHSLFLPFASTPNFLTVFISWLNLDLGIETCFYNGMDSYGKFLLQLAFPTYVFVLIGTIILLCEVSEKFATLLGNRNPVAALCTLILLSYSKLIRTIITALQFTYLNYPDGHSEIVWLYDANVPYFTVSHIPRFIAAFIVIILGAIYTILLLFGQCFSRCSSRKIMKWVKNTKYNAFIDAYHAPFIPKHRYWMGLLLFAITTHNIVAAMTTDSPAPIISAGCVALGLILLKLLNTRVYKNRLQDSLETLFLTSIVVLTVATREKDENQLALANTSMAISFGLFLVILGYHFYKYILEGSRIWARVTLQLQQIVQLRKRLRHQEFDIVPQVENYYDDNEQDELVREMEPPYYTDNKDTDSIDLPHHYDPPVIIPAVRYDQPREPDLDILDPITTDDYRQVNQPPAPRPRQVPSTTVIDFVRPHRNNIIDIDQQ